MRKLTNTRSALINEVPTFAEQGVTGVAIGTWYGLIGPANMPSELVQSIAKTLMQAGRDQTARDQLQSQGIEPQGSSPEEFTRLLSMEKTQWSDIVKTIGFKREQ